MVPFEFGLKRNGNSNRCKMDIFMAGTTPATSAGTNRVPRLAGVEMWTRGGTMSLRFPSESQGRVHTCQAAGLGSWVVSSI